LYHPEHPRGFKGMREVWHLRTIESISYHFVWFSCVIEKKGTIRF
jgi:hypothetical protein